MISSAIDATKEALQAESMQVAYLNASTFVRNEGGLRIAERVDKIEPLESEVAHLRQKTSKQQGTIGELRELADKLEKENRRLIGTLNDLVFDGRYYIAIRHRFISTTKRDVLKTATDVDYHFIQSGNVVAHHGNAELDSLLYQSGARNDVDAFEFLYGIPPGGISKMLGRFLFSSV